MKFKKYKRLLTPVLYPVSLIYSAVVAIRNMLFDVGILKSREFDIPIISVGNITVGGTGKTPHVEYILELLSGKHEIGFLSRGYRRKTKGFIAADKSSNPQRIGDEPFQVYKKFKERVKVAVDENRVEGITELQNRNPKLNAIVLDDAFQHRYVKPGVSILLIDYNRSVFKDYMLPFGELREGRNSIKRAHIVIISKVPRQIKPIEKRLIIKELNLFPYQFLFFTSIQYGKLIPVFNTDLSEIELTELRKKKLKILLVSGIANPTPLQAEIRKYSDAVSILSYADHQEYGSDRIREVKNKFNAIQADEKIIITTEKDAVKLREADFDETIRTHFYYLPVKVRFSDKGQEEFNNMIRRYVEKGKRVSRLHK